MREGRAEGNGQTESDGYSAATWSSTAESRTSPVVLFAPEQPGNSPSPLLSAESIAFGSIIVRIVSPGGDATCVVDSITVMYGQSGRPAESMTFLLSEVTKQGMTLSFGDSGYYWINAYGNCCSGNDCESTATSPGLTVYNEVSNGIQVSFSTIFSIRYNDFPWKKFTQADEEQVCVNLLKMQPGGVCSIVATLPGSVIVLGLVEYGNEAASSNLTQQLNSDSSSTESTLISGMSQNTSVTVEEAITQEKEATPADVLQAPDNIQVSSTTEGCPKTVSAQVSWNAVIQNEVLGYIVMCSTTASYPTRTSIVTGATKTSAIVKRLPQEIAYRCSVTAFSLKNQSATPSSDLFTTGYDCLFLAYGLV